MFNKITLSGRLGQNAQAKTAHSNREYVLLNVATQQSWKNDKGEYETAPNGIGACLEEPGQVRQKAAERVAHHARGSPEYREVEDDVQGTSFKHRIAEIHATSVKRLSKIDAQDEPEDGAEDE